jgi:hypothetical protein
MVLSFGGVASETMTVGNYSFTFNMTVPHQIRGDSDSIHTFDGTVFIRDWSFSNISAFDMVGTASMHTIGSTYKDTAGRGFIYAVRVVPVFYEMVFSDIEIQSHLNLTRSMDFFRDVKITRIKR